MIIYHNADFDGLFCQAVAEFFTGEKSIGWNHGDPKIEVGDELIYILDLPPNCVKDWETKKIIWIDHHKSSLDYFSSYKFEDTYCIDGVAACRLAYQYFTCEGELPLKEDYINRRVKEPYAVTLAGEFDIWDKRDKRADLFQLGLKAINISLKSLIAADDYVVADIAENGRIIQGYKTYTDKQRMKSSFIVEFEGLKFLTINGPGNSLTFASKDKKEMGHDALLLFFFNGKTWKYSMYHANHNKEIDLSAIAIKYGGGGHRGACGFESKELIIK